MDITDTATTEIVNLAVRNGAWDATGAAALAASVSADATVVLMAVVAAQKAWAATT
jgi:hypothetical protein